MVTADGEYGKMWVNYQKTTNWHIANSTSAESEGQAC